MLSHLDYSNPTLQPFNLSLFSLYGCLLMFHIDHVLC